MTLMTFKMQEPMFLQYLMSQTAVKTPIYSPTADKKTALLITCRTSMQKTELLTTRSIKMSGLVHLLVKLNSRINKRMMKMASVNGKKLINKSKILHS
jgi:hypothetical protein